MDAKQIGKDFIKTLFNQAKRRSLALFVSLVPLICGIILSLKREPTTSVITIEVLLHTLDIVGINIIDLSDN